MRQESLVLGESWERELGDPASADSSINFRAALELDESESFPQEQLDTLHRLGCFQLLIPACEGGTLYEPEQLILLGRLIARRDPTVAIAFGQSMLGGLPIWLSGSSAQKSRLASDLRQGRLGCLALTEQEHGSDILSNDFLGRQDDAGWLLSGRKWLINNACQGSTVTVLGRIERPNRSPEMALWWLRKAAPLPPQWREHPKIRTHGVRGADIGGFELVEYPTDSESLLQGAEPALYTVLKTLQISRILCSGFALGAVDTMFRITLAFARERRLYGKRAIDIPIVRARLATCFARILAADSMARCASRAIVALPRELSILSAIAKCFVPTEAEDVGRELGVLLGARHYIRSELPWGVFQKLMRDNAVVSLFDGSTPVNLSLIAAQLRALGAWLSVRALDVSAEQLLARADSLMRIDGSCAGWPAQHELRLNNEGRDSIVAAYLHAGPCVSGSSACADALTKLRNAWWRWIDDCNRITCVQRHAYDSVPVIELAQRYVTLHSCTVLALTWQTNTASGTTQPLDEAVLRLYLSSKMPDAGIEITAEVHSAVLDAAIAMVDDARLLSLHPLRISSSVT